MAVESTQKVVQLRPHLPPPPPPIASNLNCKTKTKLRALNGQRNENRSLVMNVGKHEE